MIIDLNADMGESPARLANGEDAALMRFITSANIACGAHAGDAETMEETLELARRFQVAPGAHPSYPDRENFGRAALDISRIELQDSVRTQINELRLLATKVGVRLVHVKPHGALYHACNNDPEIAAAVARAVLDVDPTLILIAQCGSRALSVYKGLGLRTAEEAFADRAYELDGSLRDRRKEGAVLEDAQRVAQQAIEIALNQRVKTVGTEWRELRADTLCIHSDTPGSSSIAEVVRKALGEAGVTVSPLQPR